MITNDIRQAAGLLRAAWWQNDFCQGEAVCVMGSIAKVYLPTLSSQSSPEMWATYAYSALTRDPILQSALEMEAEFRLARAYVAGVLAELLFGLCGLEVDLDPNKMSVFKWFKAITTSKNYTYKDPTDRVILKVCLVNKYLVKSGVEAGEFLDRVADRHAQTV